MTDRLDMPLSGRERGYNTEGDILGVTAAGIDLNSRSDAGTCTPTVNGIHQDPTK